MFTKKFITAEIIERKKADKVFLRVFLKNKFMSSFSLASISFNSGFDCVISTGFAWLFDICEFSSDICKDSGMSALGNQIQIFGKLSILVIGMPVFVQLMDTLSGLL